jgi:hypothetical protein
VKQFADFNIDNGSAAMKKSGPNQPEENRPAAFGAAR